MSSFRCLSDIKRVQYWENNFKNPPHFWLIVEHCPLSYLKGVVVEELHRLLGQVSGTALRVEDLADVLKLPGHVGVDECHLYVRWSDFEKEKLFTLSMLCQIVVGPQF